MYDWLPKSVEFDESIQLPQFSMKEWKQENCSQTYTTGELAPHTHATHTTHTPHTHTHHTHSRTEIKTRAHTLHTHTGTHTHTHSHTEKDTRALLHAHLHTHTHTHTHTRARAHAAIVFGWEGWGQAPG